MDSGFDISTRISQDVPGITVADLTGDLDTEAAYELENQLSDIVAGEGVKIILNFSKVRIMNSTAMGVLLSTAEDVRKNSGLFWLLEHPCRVEQQPLSKGDQLNISGDELACHLCQ